MAKRFYESDAPNPDLFVHTEHPEEGDNFVVEVTGGYLCFDLESDFRTWQNQQ